MKSRGRMVIISGFSGVGKGTSIGALMKKYPDEFAFSVSATTRKPRAGEVNGEAYHFLKKEEFEELIRDGKLVEYTCYQGNYYGTPEFSVFPWLEKGVNVILDIEVEGAANIKKKYPEALTIFLIPPSAAALRTRLEGRGTETEEQINGRLARAAEEAPIAKQYEALIVNDDLNVCVAELRKLKDSTGQYLWQPSLQAGEPDRVLGYKVYTSAYFPVPAPGKAAVAFGDFSYYNIGDRGSRSIAELKELFAGNGMVGFVAKERVDGKLVLPEAVKLLKMASA